MSETAQELRGNASKNGQETVKTGKRATRKSAETINATPEQQISVELQIVSAQNALQKEMLTAAQSNAEVLATQQLALTRNLTAFNVVTKAASIFEGDQGVTEVTTAFFSGMPLSGYQVGDAIANLESSQPLLLQAIAPKQLTSAA